MDASQKTMLLGALAVATVTLAVLRHRTLAATTLIVLAVVALAPPDAMDRLFSAMKGSVQKKLKADEESSVAKGAAPKAAEPAEDCYYASVPSDNGLREVMEQQYGSNARVFPVPNANLGLNSVPSDALRAHLRYKTKDSLLSPQVYPHP